MQKSYALFDFDGTLRSGDSIVSLCLFAHRKGLCSTFQLIKGLGAAAGYGLRLCRVERAKEAALCWMKGRMESEMTALAQEFCLKVLLPQMYPEGLETINREKARGAAVLLLTASPGFYLLPLKDLLGVEDVIGTRLNVDEQGRYTGEVCGDNCRGLQKPLRLAEYLAARGDRLEVETSVAYGDSLSDLPMLELCEKKIGVNASAGLKRALQNREKAALLVWRRAGRAAGRDRVSKGRKGNAGKA